MIKKTIAALGVLISVLGFTSTGANAAWKRDINGWWYTEGSSWAIGWRFINNAWYYFDDSGYMETGWLEDNGKWYYLNYSGEMVTGTQNIDGLIYDFNSHGECIEDDTIYENNENIISSDQFNDVYNRIIEMENQYPQGMNWDNSNSYTFKADGTIGYGCAGFAYLLSDAAFGSAPVKQHTDFDNIRVGDIIRMNNDTHSVVVLGFDGDYIVIAEGNMHLNGSSQGVINWGRIISRDEVKETGTYVQTRYNN